MAPACAKATKPIPSTLPVSNRMGRTAASSTSMTRLDFSSMTPIRIQVLYCVSIKNTRTRPTAEVVPAVFVVSFVTPGWRLRRGSGLAPARAADCAGERRAASTAWS